MRVFYSVAPDLPMVINFVCQAVRKRGRGLERDDIASWRYTYPIAKFLHSFFGLLTVGAFVLAAGGKNALMLFWPAYGLHLFIDYFSHARDPYPPFYPFSSWAVCTKFSYFELDRKAKQVNWTMRLVAGLGVVRVLWLPK